MKQQVASRARSAVCARTRYGRLCSNGTSMYCFRFAPHVHRTRTAQLSFHSSSIDYFLFTVAPANTPHRLATSPRNRIPLFDFGVKADHFFCVLFSVFNRTKAIFRTTPTTGGLHDRLLLRRSLFFLNYTKHNLLIKLET